MLEKFLHKYWVLALRSRSQLLLFSQEFNSIKWSYKSLELLRRDFRLLFAARPSTDQVGPIEEHCLLAWRWQKTLRSAQSIDLLNMDQCLQVWWLLVENLSRDFWETTDSRERRMINLIWFPHAFKVLVNYFGERRERAGKKRLQTVR